MTRSVLSNSRGRDTSKNAFGIFKLSTMVFMGLIGVAQLGMALALLQLSARPAPTLVQQSNGQPMIASYQNSTARTPETIRQFVLAEMQLLFSISGQVPATDVDGRTTRMVQDKGVGVPGTNRHVTTAANTAIYGISQDFRVEFLRQLALITPEDAWTGALERSLLITSLSEPIQIEDGRWKLFMVATVQDRLPNGALAGRPEGFNREIFVQSIPPLTNFSFDTDWQNEIEAIRQSGLEIYGIRPYTKPADMGEATPQPTESAPE